MSRSSTLSATCARLRARADRSRLRRARCSAEGVLSDREAVVEEAQDHVHVPPRADGAGELAQHLEGPAHPPALPLAGEQRQRDPQAPAGHADLVDRAPPGRPRPRAAPGRRASPGPGGGATFDRRERRGESRLRHRESPNLPRPTACRAAISGYNDAPSRRHPCDEPRPRPTGPPLGGPAPRPVAVLDMGASAIRLVVAELPPGEPPRILEEASRAVLLGKDAFTGGRLGAATIEATLRALEGFRRIMDSYGVVRYRAVATSAVREAVNRDTFLDRVRLRTGIDVEVIDGSEENRLTYVAVREALQDHEALDERATRCSSRWAAAAPTSPSCARGEPVYSGTYALGAIRMRQNLAAWHGSHEQRVRLFRRTVQNIVEDIRREMPLREARHFLALGGDVRFAADQIVGDDAGARRAGLPARAVPLVLRADGGRSTTSSSWSAYHLPLAEVETLVPALLVYRELAPRDPGREGARPRGDAAGGAAPRHGAGRRGPRDRGLLAPGAGLGRGARGEVPLRRAARAARGVASRCGSSTTCAPSTASGPGTACSSRWRRSSTTSASS